MRHRLSQGFAAVVLAAFTGCTDVTVIDVESVPKSQIAPAVYHLGYSEYPSWQVFDVAHNLGYIDKTRGKMGPLETKYNVDIVLVRADYTETIKMYGSGTVAAVCVTNTDVLKPAMTRASVAVFPTSTSQGADACIVTGIKTIQDLKGKTVRGAEQCVSEFAFYRILGKYGLTSKDVAYKEMDPAAASAAMTQGQAGFEAIMVWEPFIEDVLKRNSNTKILFDSKEIPMEVIDMVVVGKDVYQSPTGEAFARLLAETFYKTCNAIKGSDQALAQLGEEFAHLTADEMRVIHNPLDTAKSKCRFFDTPKQGDDVFRDPKFPGTLRMITQFCLDRGIVKTEPTVRHVGQADPGKPVNLMFTLDVMAGTTLNAPKP